MSSQSPNALMTELRLILKKPMAFFIYDSFAKVYPKTASAEMGKVLKDNHNAKLAQKENPDVFKKRDLFAEKIDIHGLLLLIEHGWAGVFASNYPDSMREDARFLLPKRHASSHDTLFSLQDIQEAAQTAEFLLNEMKTTEANEAITKIRQLLRHDYYRHIPVAEHYIARPELLEAMQTELLKSTAPSLALHGMGGIGKSVLLRALCDEQAIQTRFADGILWMSFGREVHEAQLGQKLREWIKALNGTTHDVEPGLDALENRLAELLKNQACLLILDDVWTKKQLETFRVAGVNCRIIFSTRDAEIARETGAKIISVAGLDNELTAELLEKWSDGNFKNTARLSLVKLAIVIRLGGLPLAVKLAGTQLRTKTPEQWLDNFDARQFKSKRIEQIHDSLEHTFDLSLDELDETSRQLYFALSILRGSVIPEQVVMRLWEGLAQFDEHQTREVLADLVARALCIEVQGDLSARSIHISDLLCNLLLHRTENQPALHQVLVDSYKKAQTGSGWHTVADDGYFYTYFAYHLYQAGAFDVLHDVLLNYLFIQTRLNVSDIKALIGDYAYLDELDNSLQAVLLVLINYQSELEENPQELPRVLYENLFAVQDMSPQIAALLDDCYQLGSPSLYTINQIHLYPNGVIAYSLPAGTSKVYRLRIGKKEMTQEELDFLQIGFGGLRDFFDFVKRQDEDTLPEDMVSFARLLKGDIEILPKGANFLFGDAPGIGAIHMNGVGEMLTFHSASIRSINFWSEYAISIDIENKFCVWSCRTGQLLHPRIVKISKRFDDTQDEQPTKRANEAVQLDDTLIVRYDSDNGYLQFSDTQTGEFVNVVPNERSAYSDKLIISNEADTLNICNAQTDEIISTFYIGEDSPQFVLAIAEDSSIIALGTEYGYVYLLRPNAALLKILRDIS